MDVATPAAGTWTLYNAASKSSGFDGPIQYNVTQTDFTYPGSITPSSLNLGAGKTGVFHVHSQLPATPGDVSLAVQLSGANGVLTSVPLTLRADVPTHDTTWTGTITGGNGRAQGGPAQSNFYYLNVPKNAAQISAGFTFTDPDQIYLATLAAPDGQVYSFQSNASFDGNGNLQAANGLQIYRRYPQAGKWELTLETTNPVSGEELAGNFTAAVAYEPLEITGTRFPNGPKMRLTSGVPVNFPVNITNTGTTALTYFADGRLNTAGTIPLQELSGNATTALPVPAGVNPIWLVPSEVTSLAAQSVADQPVNLDFYYKLRRARLLRFCEWERRHGDVRSKDGVAGPVDRRCRPDRTVRRSRSVRHRDHDGDRGRPAVRPGRHIDHGRPLDRGRRLEQQPAARSVVGTVDRRARSGHHENARGPRDRPHHAFGRAVRRGARSDRTDHAGAGSERHHHGDDHPERTGRDGREGQAVHRRFQQLHRRWR